MRRLSSQRISSLDSWTLHQPFLTYHLDSLELSRISNFLKFQMWVISLRQKRGSGGTLDCNNVLIGRHIPIQTAKSGGELQPPQFWREGNLSKRVSRQTGWYQLTLMACINARGRCQLWAECDLFDTLDSSWFAAASFCLSLTKLALTNPTNSNPSTCVELLHKIRGGEGAFWKQTYHTCLQWLFKCK